MHRIWTEGFLNDKDLDILFFTMLIISAYSLDLNAPPPGLSSSLSFSLPCSHGAASPSVPPVFSSVSSSSSSSIHPLLILTAFSHFRYIFAAFFSLISGLK